jgi:hypothetical protein
VFEQGGPSRNIPVVELSSSSDEEGFFAVTARDAEFAKLLFNDLNHDLLGPPGNGKVIVISDSDDEEEEREETTADVEVAPSVAGKFSTPASSAPLLMKTWGKCKMIIVMILPLTKTQERAVVAETNLGCLRLPRLERLLR